MFLELMTILFFEEFLRTHAALTTLVWVVTCKPCNYGKCMHFCKQFPEQIHFKNDSA